MALWGYSTEELAAEIKRRALGMPLSRDYSPGIAPAIQASFVKIPTAGIAAASLAGRKPSVTLCDKYDPVGVGGRLEPSLDSEGEQIQIDVRHYGAAITALDEHDFEYLQVRRMRGGWVIDVEYCNGDVAPDQGVVGTAIVGTSLVATP